MKRQECRQYYEIIGEYPDKGRFHAYVAVKDQKDAIAMAQGIRKVTTVNAIGVYRTDDTRCVYYDRLKAPEL